MRAAMAVMSPPYAYSYSLHQTLDPSCSPSPSSAPIFRCPSSPKVVSSFYGARISLSRGLNLVRRAYSDRQRYGLGSVSRRPGIKAVVTPESALELPLTAENVESVLDEIRPYLIADGVESIPDEETGLELNEENIEKVLEEIRPYLVGAAGGDLELIEIEEPIVKVRITGPAAGVMTVRVAVTQKLREKIPAIAAVQLLS
ncbi:UNVERIFIED_CONTAM: NifU-like protein 2, chloroplastic [Sesamum calycinum]|uniref:NifU-like protein 2, chloroplastic n=1 Tax=Sesamum calycinum TaxID=2727403 RepID=A0AAW2R7P8_9LAMI